MNSALVVLLSLLSYRYSVIQQPLPTYVGPEVTQFDTARRVDSVGLLAHDWYVLESLGIGDVITIRFDSGEDAQYVVFEVDRATAETAFDPYSDFKMDGEVLTSTQLFYREYRPYTLTLQTCEGRDGRLFILARPYAKEEREETQDYPRRAEPY